MRSDRCRQPHQGPLRGCWLIQLALSSQHTFLFGKYFPNSEILKIFEISKISKNSKNGVYKLFLVNFGNSESKKKGMGGGQGACADRRAGGRSHSIACGLRLLVGSENDTFGGPENRFLRIPVVGGTVRLIIDICRIPGYTSILVVAGKVHRSSAQ